MNRTLTLATLLTFVIPPWSFLLAQGPLTPPGAPTPTMKTLDQLDAKLERRTPISALPFTISAAGSYYLTGNLTLTGGANQHGITINADNVTLDLGGFELVNSATGLNGGIRLINTHVNATIRNGTVRGWTSSGVFAETGAGTELRVEHLRVFGSGGSGIAFGDKGTAVDCEVRGNTANGISGGAFCKVMGCTATDTVSADGINVGAESLVSDCVAANNGGDGIQTGVSSKVTGCATFGNSGFGFNLASSSAIAHCTANTNTSSGIAGSTLISATGCTASGNGQHGFFLGQGASLSNCTSADSTMHGFNLSDTASVHNCSATNNTGNGFACTLGCTLTSCSAQGNRGVAGIATASACTIIGCTLRANTSTAGSSAGISAGGESLVSQCVVSNTGSTAGTLTASTGMGINVGAASSVERCTVQGSKGDGIRVSSSCLVLGNTCDRNGDTTGDGAGIHSTGSENRIEANSVTGNDRGIEISAAGNLIIKNTATTNTTAYAIAANNRFGPIINISALGVAAVSVNNASANVPSMLASTDPWANFLY